jgi:hypothetical protein
VSHRATMTIDHDAYQTRQIRVTRAAAQEANCNKIPESPATGNTLTVCAWCGSFAVSLSDPSHPREWFSPTVAERGQIADGRRISHGICNACEAEWR